MDIDRGKLIQFMMEFFDDEEIVMLCLVEFREVHSNFASGMGKRQKVLDVVAWCDRHGETDKLLNALQREREPLFQEWFGEHVAARPPRSQRPQRSPAPTPTRNPRQIFLSHAHEDAAFAQRLAADLEAAGWAVWIAPDSIQPGEQWVTAINRGLEESGVFVLILTPSAIASEWVNRETNAAIELELSGKIKFVPLQKAPCSIPMLWKNFQILDFSLHYERSFSILRGLLSKYRQSLDLRQGDFFVYFQQAPEEDWQLPSVEELLEKYVPPAKLPTWYIGDQIELIEETFRGLGAPVTVVEIYTGPTITFYGVEPGYMEDGSNRKIQLSQIKEIGQILSSELDIPLARLQIPVAGKGYVGIEIPNERRSRVSLRYLMESEEFRFSSSDVTLVFGESIFGKPVIEKLSNIPSLLIIGNKHSGKTTCLLNLVSNLIIQCTPMQLRLLIMSSDSSKLTLCNELPHLISDILTNPREKVFALRWAILEMENRYKLLRESNSRNLGQLNKGTSKEPIPRLVIIIQGLADMVDYDLEGIRENLRKLSRMGPAVGIFVVISTEKISEQFLPTEIKESFPARVVLRVDTYQESEMLLGVKGAESLLGDGDMYFRKDFFSSPIRVQGVYVPSNEFNNLVSYWYSQSKF